MILRSNRTYIWRHPAEIISVKWGKHDLEVTIKMWSPDDEEETIRTYKMFTHHEETFPYVIDGEPDELRRKFPFISGSSGFSFQTP